MTKRDSERGKKWAFTDEAMTKLTFMLEELTAYKFLFEQLDSSESDIRGFHVTIGNLGERVADIMALLEKAQNTS